MTVAPTPRSARNVQLDALRGVVIVGVVLGHVLRGLMEPGIVSAQYGVGEVNERVIYLIRLPMLVLLTGVLMPASVDRRGTKNYLIARIPDILWLYVVWTLLQGGVEVLTSAIKNTPTTWAQVLRLWEPIAQLWYLPFLAIATVVIAVVKPWRSTARLVLGLAFSLPVSAWFWGQDGTTVLTRGMSLLVIAMAGAVIGRDRLLALCGAMPRPALAAIGAAGLAVATILGLHTGAIMPTSDHILPWSIGGVALGMVAAAAGMVGSIALVFAFTSQTGPVSSFLAMLGRNTLVIYVGHITVMAATRILLLRLGVDSAVIHIVAGTVVGTLAPLLIVSLARYVPWLIRAPRPLRELPA